MSQLLGGRERTAGIRFLIRVYCCLSELKWAPLLKVSIIINEHVRLSHLKFALLLTFSHHLSPWEHWDPCYSKCGPWTWSTGIIVKLGGDAEPEPHRRIRICILPTYPGDGYGQHWKGTGLDELQMTYLIEWQEERRSEKENVTEVLDSVRTKAACYGCIRTSLIYKIINHKGPRKILRDHKSKTETIKVYL